MCRNNRQRPSPLRHRLRHPIQHPLVLVQRKFIQFDMTPLAGQCVRIRRHAANPPAIKKLDHMSPDIVNVCTNNSRISPSLKHFCPLRAIFDILSRLLLVPRRNPHIHRILNTRCLLHRIISIGKRGSDLPAFLHKPQRRSIINPRALIRQKIFLFPIHLKVGTRPVSRGIRPHGIASH